MKCKWIIENFTNSEDYRDLALEVRNSGRECFVIGKGENKEFNIDWISPEDLVIIQGSINMVRSIRSTISEICNVHTFITEGNYLCSKYYPILGEYLFNDRHAFVYLGTLKKNKFEYYSKFGKEALIFVRPDRGDKPFTGQLLDLKDFDRFWENGIQSSSGDNDLIIVSTPKNIVGEWRVVCDGTVEGGNIITESTYIYQGQKTIIPSMPDGARVLCDKILSTLSPETSFQMMFFV